MKSSGIAPPQVFRNAEDSHWVGVVPVHGNEINEIAAFLIAIENSAAHPKHHVCFVMDAAIAADTHSALNRLRTDVRCSIVMVEHGVNEIAAIDVVASRHPACDLVLLALDASLPYAWDARLKKAVYAEKNIAAATALCDIAPMFTLVEGALPEDGRVDSALIDRTTYAMGNRSYYEVPKVHGVCTYFRRDALDALSMASGRKLSEDASSVDVLARLLRAAGRSCVLCDYVYVGTERRLLDPPATDDIEELAFRQHHPLGRLRRSVAAAIKEGISSVSVPGLDSRPVQLHIMHFWGGGLDKWVRDFGRLDTSRVNLVFSSFRIGDTGGQRLVLYSDPVDPNPIRVWDIAQPIRSTLPNNIEYRQILEQIIREFSVDAIIVSSLIGHTLDAVDLDLKTLVVCHDFYPICQAINPQFGKTCERCTKEDLRICAQSNPLNSIFVDQTSDDWHTMRSLYVDRLLARKIELVVPSPSVEATLKRLAPKMRELTFHLVPHGIDMQTDRLPMVSRTAAEPLRLVVLGRLSVHKGTELLRAAAKALRPIAQITLVGGGGNGAKLAEACGWHCIEKFEPNELPDILRKLAPHAGILASVIPETFSYTLSELNFLGLPSLSTALGSFNDRIVDGHNGFLFPPTAEGLVVLVTRLHGDPQLLTGVAETLSKITKHRTVAEMVADYHAILPLLPQAVARFPVGIGMDTGLTDPYRHLTGAYAQLTGAYEHTKNVYSKSLIDRDELQEVATLGIQWAYDFDAMNIRRKWWRALSTLQLTEEYREKLGILKRGAPRDPSGETDTPGTKTGET